jgi:hypothetical protein
MKRKQAKNLTTARLFAFTFKDSDNYIFQIAADATALW